MTTKISIIVTTLAALIVLTLPVLGNSESNVAILVADNPETCLSLESFALTDNGYMLVDGRNNMAKVKFIDDAGNITHTGVPTIPLPDGASLPADILPTPWGLDRVTYNSDGIWAVPSSWSGGIAEKFDTTTGEFIERLPDPGIRVSGMITGPNDDVWAVSRRILINVSSGTQESLNLTGSVFHIDTAVGHPLGFLIYEQPDLFLIDSNQIIRWRINLDGVLDYFISPLDIAAGPDGSIVIGAVLCDMTDEEVHAEYYDVRGQQLQNDYEEGLFILEDTLRYELAVGFALIMIDPDGTINDVIEMGTAPTSVAVDDGGRYHILSQEDNGWGIYIWDPRLDQDFEVAHFPMGEPAMISPHRVAAGRDGSIYWDDMFAGETESYWGIGKYSLPDSSGLFSLSGSTFSTESEWIIRDTLYDSFYRTSALQVTESGDLVVGLTEFLLNPPDEDDPDLPPFSTSVRRYDRNGLLLYDRQTSDIVGEDVSFSDFLETTSGLVGLHGGSNSPEPFGFLLDNGTWEPSGSFNDLDTIGYGRIAPLPEKIISWLLASDSGEYFGGWYLMNDDLTGPYEIEQLEILNGRLLATDSVNRKIYMTIDDGDIFRLDASDYYVDGIWSNRMLSGAPAHAIQDAVYTTDGLVYLDRANRAILRIEPYGFNEPPMAIPEDIDQAISIIRVALSEFKSLYGMYPPYSSGLLDEILAYDEIELVKRAFLGGRIYNYTTTELGYSFVAWSAAAGQPVLLCSDIDTVEYN